MMFRHAVLRSSHERRETTCVTAATVEHVCAWDLSALDTPVFGRVRLFSAVSVAPPIVGSLLASVSQWQSIYLAPVCTQEDLRIMGKRGWRARVADRDWWRGLVLEAKVHDVM
ncbi:hypothetical protein LSTR_LSTR005447 [Laodelphax striatellus]|uniref:Uncharacterized protein n=1 Tax=Laodelphax striatellus TaxID=195883 RepID=A0A482WWI5_LAOST|nr:hypothetical protein LSTR_LSTR005447 [Laodelphax striatellus]